MHRSESLKTRIVQTFLSEPRYDSFPIPNASRISCSHEVFSDREPTIWNCFCQIKSCQRNDVMSVSTNDLQANLRSFLITPLSGDMFTSWMSSKQQRFWLDVLVLETSHWHGPVLEVWTFVKIGNLRRIVGFGTHSALSLPNLCSYRTHKQDPYFEGITCTTNVWKESARGNI